MSSLKPIGYPFVELLSTDSTNNYAMGIVHAGLAQHGMVVFTHEQTRGRGQRSKSWISEPGNNIAVSLILQPERLSLSQLFLLSKTMALGAYYFFNNYAGSDVTIKWPNDIYWRDRKAGGILIENVIQGSEWKFAIAGLGINVNQEDFGELGTRAVSLKQITSKSFSALTLAKELCIEIQKQWELMIENPEAINTDYEKHLYKINEVVRLKKDSRIFEARIKSVSDCGELIVDSGMEERFGVGDIEWVF